MITEKETWEYIGSNIWKTGNLKIGYKYNITDITLLDQIRRDAKKELLDEIMSKFRFDKIRKDEREKEKMFYQEIIKQVHPLNKCDDSECILCGIAHCPHAEPLHFHHDGCPACYRDELKTKTLGEKQDGNTISNN